MIFFLTGRARASDFVIKAAGPANEEIKMALGNIGITQLSPPGRVVLTALNPSFQSAAVAVPALTSEISVKIRRPTTLLSQNWDATSTMRITLVYVLDGIEHKAVGQSTGGIRTGLGGAEIPFYELKWHPTTQKINGVWKRIGENASTRTAYVLLERLTGIIDTEVTLAQSIDEPAPLEL